MVSEQKDLLKHIYLKLLKDSVKEVKYQALLGFLEVINYSFLFYYQSYRSPDLLQMKSRSVHSKSLLRLYLKKMTH